jgi:hypothetical protein
MLWQVKKIMHFHFPDLQERLSTLSDPRIGIQYTVEELIMAAIMLFLLKCDSRNEFNHKQRDRQFRDNYYRMFRMNLPHMDAVDDLLERIIPTEIEELRCRLIQSLIEKRVFHRFRFYQNHFYVAIDGTGVYNWGEEPVAGIHEHAIRRESSKGKVTYSGQVLEAVLVYRNGMSIPLLSEWIANEGKEYDKQDCELKAFKRLSVRLKKYLPRLNICILADGLYSNVSLMDICRKYDWKFLAVFRDGNLPSVWAEVESLLPLTANVYQQHLCDSTHWVTRNYRWVKQIDYKSHDINWIECEQIAVHRKTKVEISNRFVFLTNWEVNSQSIVPLLTAGRARWYIEDHFNTQKNRGGSLHHKFNRTNFNALKNWHHLRQLVCMINECVKHTQELMQMLRENAKLTLKELWKNLNSYLSMCCVDNDITEFEQWGKQPRQVRLE